MKKIISYSLVFFIIILMNICPDCIIQAIEKNGDSDFEKNLIGLWDYKVGGICSGGADCDISIMGETGYFEFQEGHKVIIHRHNSQNDPIIGTFHEVEPRILSLLFEDEKDNKDDFYLEMNSCYEDEVIFRIDVKDNSGNISEYDSLVIALKFTKI